MESQELVEALVHALGEKQARQIVMIDVAEISSVADYVVICHGTSSTHIQALSHAIREYAKEQSLTCSYEGEKDGSWVLVDMGTVIVHIMNEKLRQFYDLENLWGHGHITYVE